MNLRSKIFDVAAWIIVIGWTAFFLLAKVLNLVSYSWADILIMAFAPEIVGSVLMLLLITIFKLKK